MITTLIIVLGLVLLGVINNQISSFLKRKYPEKSEKEFLKVLYPKTQFVLLTGLFIILCGVFYVNVFYKTEKEIKEEKAQAIADQEAKKRNDEAARAIYAEKNKPVKEKLDEFYHDMNTSTDKNITAGMWFNSLVKLYDEVKGTEYEKRFEKTRDSLDKVSFVDSQKREVEARKKYGEDFRNKLLDNGLNIKVSVYGKDNKKIKLTYILFNEVWRRKFETEGYFDQLHNEGFTDILLTDGYDYAEGVRYKN